MCLYQQQVREFFDLYLFFFSCLSALLIAFYMAKNKPEDGLLNFKLEETKVVVVSCDSKSQAKFPRQFSFTFISEY